MSLTPKSKSFGDLFTTSGGTNGYVMGPAGLYVPQAAPAIEYDADSHAPLGLRCRGEAATNVLTASVAGTADAAYFTTANAPGIVQGQAAKKYTRTATGSNALFYSSSFVAGTGQVMTWWGIYESDPITPNTGLFLNFFNRTGSAQRVLGKYNLQTGAATVTLTGGASGSASMTLLQTVGPNGGKVWFCRLVGTVINGEEWRAEFYPDRTDAATLGVVGNIQYAHHWQLEAGAVDAPSPIVTSGETVTRSVDFVSIADLPSKPWWNAAEGTVLIDFTKRGAANTTASERVLTIRSSSAERIMVFMNYSTGLLSWLLTTGGSEKFRVGLGANPVDSERTQLVLSFQNGRFIASRNGGTPSVTTGAHTLPTGSLAMLVGSDPADAARLNGVVHQMRYWPKAANASEIASITPSTAIIQG